MERLLILDQQIFFIINHLPHTELTNALALAISGIGTAGLIWFLITAILFSKEEHKDHWFFLPFLFAGGTSWALVELILKPLVARVRPTELMGAIIVGPASQDFSMPSGHATIAFAMAVVLSRKEPKWKWMFFTLAVLISLSRIYLGVHYPLDVVAGGVIGWLIGNVVNRLTR
ncbi:MAG: phosphatase PAP2 family protein [Patescibacteria group bacterium]